MAALISSSTITLVQTPLGLKGWIKRKFKSKRKSKSNHVKSTGTSFSQSHSFSSVSTSSTSTTATATSLTSTSPEQPTYLSTPSSSTPSMPSTVSPLSGNTASHTPQKKSSATTIGSTVALLRVPLPPPPLVPTPPRPPASLFSLPNQNQNQKQQLQSQQQEQQLQYQQQRQQLPPSPSSSISISSISTSPLSLSPVVLQGGASAHLTPSRPLPRSSSLTVSSYQQQSSRPSTNRALLKSTNTNTNTRTTAATILSEELQEPVIVASATRSTDASLMTYSHHPPQQQNFDHPPPVVISASSQTLPFLPWNNSRSNSPAIIVASSSTCDLVSLPSSSSSLCLAQTQPLSQALQDNCDNNKNDININDDNQERSTFTFSQKQQQQQFPRSVPISYSSSFVIDNVQTSPPSTPIPRAIPEPPVVTQHYQHQQNRQQEQQNPSQQPPRQQKQKDSANRSFTSLSSQLLAATASTLSLFASPQKESITSPPVNQNSLLRQQQQQRSSPYRLQRQQRLQQQQQQLLQQKLPLDYRHHQAVPQRSDHYLYNSHRNDTPTEHTFSFMSSFHTPSSQPNQRFHPQKQHQQNKVYLSQSTKMFKSFSSRFGASTETLPVVETVAQEYARTIKALWRMVEEEELSQRMADARTEDEREQIILEHTQQQLHNQNPYQHQRTSSSSWLLPMHVQTQRTCASSLTATSSSQNKRASHQSGLTTGSRSSMGTYVQPQQNNNKASQDDQRHLQRSKTAPTETLATSVTRHQMQRQQLSRNESLPHRQPHHYSVPPTSSTLVNATCGGQAQNNASYQRRSVPNPVRNSMMLMMSTMRPLSQISDATSSCEDNDDVDDDDDDDGIILSPFSPSSSVYSSEFYVNDMNAKWKKDLKGQPTTLSINQNLKESSLPMLSSSVQQAAQTLQKHDHCTIEERIWMEEDWRLQARLLKSADIPMTPLCSSKKPVLAKKVLRVTQIKNNDAVIDDNDDDNDVDSVIDPDLLSAEYREAFLRRCSNFEPEPKRQDAEADEDERQGARAFCDLEFGRGRFHCGEKYEVEEEDDEIVIAHKIGVRSSRLMQWGTSPGFNATAGGNPAL